MKNRAHECTSCTTCEITWCRKNRNKGVKPRKRKTLIEQLKEKDDFETKGCPYKR